VLLGPPPFSGALAAGPIAVLFGLIALIRGQYALGAIGTITGAAAILTSPWLWTGIGSPGCMSGCFSVASKCGESDGWQTTRLAPKFPWYPKSLIRGNLAVGTYVIVY